MVVGVLIGALAPDVRETLKPLSTVFLRMIKSIIVPIIFGTLVVGIAGHGDDMKRVGRLALKSIIYFEIVTTLALVDRALRGEHREARRREWCSTHPLTPGQELAQKTPDGTGFLEHLVPQSFFEAAANNEVLQVVFFVVLFAVALSQVQGRPKEIVLAARRARRSDVQVHGDRDALRADRYRCGDRGHGRAQRARRSPQPRQAGADALRRAGRLLPARVASGSAAVPRSAQALHPRGEGAGADRVLDDVVGGGAAARDAGDGSDRGAATHRRVRDADGILVQSRRIDALSGGRVDVRRPGSGTST